MIIYKDAVTGSELFTDTYKVKLVDGCLYEVDCEMKKYDMNDSSATAACAFNPSAEGEGGEDVDDNPDLIRAINLVRENRLQDHPGFDKKTYQFHLKDYIKNVKAHLAKTNPDRLDGFVADAKVAAGKILKKIKDYEFFTGEIHYKEDEENPEKMHEGMVILCDYREDGITPYLTFWKDAIIEEKC